MKKRLSHQTAAAIMKVSLIPALILVTTFCAYAGEVAGQKLLETRITLKVKGEEIKNVFAGIEKLSDIKFVYSPELIDASRKVNLDVKRKALFKVLGDLLKPLGLRYELIHHYIILHRLETKNTGPSAGETPPTAFHLPPPIPIKGKVSGAEGQPLEGVSVMVKHSNNGTVTDARGEFSLRVPDGQAVLVISYVGYQSQEVPVGSRLYFAIALTPNSSQLSDIVVIGYGSQKRVDVTSSVATVKSENFVKGNVLDAGQLLQGKVAGLTISAPSGDPTSGSQILLRGNTTLLGANSNPLVLIDGIPGDLKTVAPEDIGSIDVLKDGSAAAIYGTRGTNGVIIITTRRASGNYTNSVEYSGYASTETIERKLDMLTAADYRKQIADGLRDPSWDLGTTTDWIREVTRTPLSHVHNLTLRGGNSRTNYLANVNYRDLQGIFKKSDNHTFTARADINHSMFDNKLKLNIGILNSNNNYTTTGDGYSFNGYVYRQALIRNPTSPVYDSTGHWFEQTGIFNYENPLSRLYESDGENSSQNTRLNATLTLTPVRGLNLKSLFSYTRYNQERGYAETKNHISTLRDGKNGYASVGSTQSIDRLMELTAEYSHNLGNHSLTLLGGYSYQENAYRTFWMQNWDFPTDQFGYNDIGIGNALKKGLAPEYSYKSETNLIGFFSRLTYNYKDKYLLLASFRYEAASQLYGTKHPWGTFPAVSAGWRITKEPFMQNQHLFDELKLRAGYGVTGTQPSDLFLGVALLGYGNYVLSNGTWIQTLGPSQNPNPNLKWEEKHETDIGLDFSMHGGRVSGSVDYYIRQIKDLLYDYQVPSPPNLYPSTRANVGTMENRGLEVMVNITPIQTKDFVWNSSFSFSTNTNKLKSLSNSLYHATNNYFTTGYTGEPIQTFTNIVQVGRNIGDFYGFKVIGVSDDGKWIYEGSDGKPVNYDDFNHSFEDKQVLGNGLPRYYAGWNNTLRYKKLDMSITMRGAFKYQILNFQRMYYENPSLQQYNQLKSAYDNVFGKAVLNKDMALEFNSYYIENGDFWKIDNITVGYNIEKTGIPYIHSARVFVSTLNTFVITGYKGIDPEVNRIGLAPGNDDRDKYPTTRTYTIGINLNL